MATTPSLSTSVADTMARLSTKPGVSATVAIDRTTASVLQSTGKLGFISTMASSKTPTPSVAPALVNGITADGSTTTLVETEEDGMAGFAKMIWDYVNSTGQLVHDMDTEDDVKLLRLRTRKHELVIVPDSKFIFVVVHDVPSS